MAACLPGATLGTHASPFSGPAGGPPRTGQSFIAIDPGATSGGAFGERVAAILAAYAAEPGAHLPGSGRRQARERTAAAGVLVDGEIYARAAALAG
jgi:(2R)-3-sulfolactate dehydrogenase (NADP+)